MSEKFCHFVLTTKATQPHSQVFSVNCSVLWQLNAYENAHKILRILPDFICKNNRFSAFFKLWADVYSSSVCEFYWWVESVWLLLHKFWSHFGILILESSITMKKAIFRLSSMWSWHTYTIVRNTQSSCGGPLTWKARILDGLWS